MPFGDIKDEIHLASEDFRDEFTSSAEEHSAVPECVKAAGDGIDYVERIIFLKGVLGDILSWLEIVF